MEEEENNQMPYDSEKDVNDLNEALKEKGTEEKIVEIICNRKNSERQEIIEKFRSAYGKELVDELKSKLSGGLKELILGLMMTSVDYDVEQLYLSMKGAGTDEDLLSEIVATRTSAQLAKIVERYPTLKGESLSEAISGDTSKEYKNLLLAMISGKRSENPYPNTKKMLNVIKELKEGKDGKIAKDNFVKYFANCSYGEICTICRLFERTYNVNMVDFINKELNGDFRDLLIIILKYISDSGKFFAEKINKFEKKDVMRILISRSEVDMDDIRDAYKDLYKKELVEDIKEKYSDKAFQTALIILAEK